MSGAFARVADQIDLPAPVAAWVLGAHAFTLSMPIVLLVVAWTHHDELTSMLARPVLVPVAAALLLAGSVFEVAQNTQDRWYYTGPYPAFADMFFVLLITAGLGTLGLAASDDLWVGPASVAAIIGVLVLYRFGDPGFPALGVAGLIAAVALARQLDHPGVLLLLVANGGGSAYFLELVKRTQAQSMHGCIALSNGLGTLVVIWVLVDATDGGTIGWAPVLLVAAVAVVLGAAAWRVLSNLAPTPYRLPKS